MTNARRFCLISCAVAVSALLLGADQTAEFKSFFATKRGELERAFNTKNIKWFEANSAPEFTYVDFKGVKRGRKESIEGLRQMFGMMKSMKTTIKVSQISAKNNVGTMLVEQGFVGTIDAGTGKLQKIETVTWSKDTWKKIKGKWLIVSVKETKAMTMKIDGRKVDPYAGM